MKKRNYILLLMGFILMSSCGLSNQSKSERNEEPISMQKIIDNSKDQIKVIKLLYENSTMKDGKITFKMSKRAFKKEGLDGDTYDYIQKLIKDYNKMIDSDASKKAQSSVKEFVGFVADKLKELSK